MMRLFAFPSIVRRVGPKSRTAIEQATAAANQLNQPKRRLPSGKPQQAVGEQARQAKARLLACLAAAFASPIVFSFPRANILGTHWLLLLLLVLLLISILYMFRLLLILRLVMFLMFLLLLLLLLLLNFKQFLRKLHA